MCLYPVKVRNRKYEGNKRNDWGRKSPIPTPIHGGMYKIGAACGNCLECRKMKGRDWRVRMGEEIKDRDDARMLTFTFSDEWLNKLRLKVNEKRMTKLNGWDLDNQVCVYAVRQFGNRYIKYRTREKKDSRSLRRWIVTELGGENDRIHMHGIVFTDENKDDLELLWKYGFIGEAKNGYVNEKTINYITKYFTKVDKEHKGYKPRMMVSPGMGVGYVERAKRKHRFRGEYTNESYRMRDGTEMPLPMYYRKKLWNDDEREELWYHNIMKDEQWVNGHKLKESDKDFEKQYSGAIESGRRRSERLGYGKRDKNWDMKRFDKEGMDMRRKLREAKQDDSFAES